MVLILKESSLPWEWATIVEGVEDYLDLMRDAQVSESAVSPLALQINAIRVWASHVTVGGHCQFVGMLRDNTLPKLSKALEGAVACDIPDWIDILSGAIAWIEANPQEVAGIMKSSGGSSTELQALDRRFVESWTKSEERLILTLSRHRDVRLVQAQDHANALRLEASRLLGAGTDPNGAAALLIAAQCRTWLSDADNVAFALAWGAAGFRTILPAGLRPTGLPDGSTYGEFLAARNGGKRELWYAVRSPKGLRFQTEMPPLDGKLEVIVTLADIATAQSRAEAFRLPEMIGHCLASMGQGLTIKSALMASRRDFPWLPSKARVIWSCDCWIINATRESATFTDRNGKRKATLKPDQLLSDLQIEWTPTTP